MGDLQEGLLRESGATFLEFRSSILSSCALKTIVEPWGMTNFLSIDIQLTYFHWRSHACPLLAV